MLLALLVWFYSHTSLGNVSSLMKLITWSRHIDALYNSLLSSTFCIAHNSSIISLTVFSFIMILSFLSYPMLTSAPSIVLIIGSTIANVSITITNAEAIAPVRCFIACSSSSYTLSICVYYTPPCTTCQGFYCQPNQ